MVWNPATKSVAERLERIQNKAVRYISELKGRESVSDARSQLKLKTLASHRRDHRVGLLGRILGDEEHTAHSRPVTMKL